MSARDEAGGGVVVDAPLPCPMCQSDDIMVLPDAVMCRECGIRTGQTFSSPAEGVEFWNDRTPSPRDQACSAMLGALERLRGALEREHKRGETFPASVSIAAYGADKAIALARSAGIEPLALPVGGKVMT